MQNEEQSTEESNRMLRSKKQKKIIITTSIVILLIVTNCVSFVAGGFLTFNGVFPWIRDKVIAQKLDGISDVSKYKKLFSIRDTIYKKYDGEIDDNKLLDGAIKGMSQALGDPYTYYMDAKEYKNYMDKVNGSFLGLGINITAKNDKIYVIKPQKGSPAEKAGVKSGDYILKVNGKSYTGAQLDDAIAVMKGDKKEEVKLTILRGDNQTLEIGVVRDEIKNESVSGEMVTSNIGYIMVSGFELYTADDFNAKLTELKKAGMKGLILDLRDNPGGYLFAAVNLVSNFIPKDKLVVSTIDKYNSKEESLSKGGEAIGMPLVLLVNGNSASASEIVSGAVRDYKIGTLVGERTFGKGIVQVTLEDKKDGSALKVTISKYYSPLGINIHKKGIAPDVEVKYPKELLDKPYDRTKDPQFKKALEIVQDKIK